LQTRPSIVDDSVQFYWDIISEGTIAQGATLHFDRRPAMLRCQGCCCEFPMNEGFVCPQCHSQQVSLISGDEFYLDTINVEELIDEPNSCN
jgi:hydrogenase nickel incorporation protein HypA/HybF